MAQVNFADVQREQDAARVSLALVFGREFAELWASTDATNVIRDYMLAFREDGCTVSQYRDRIGAGNLLAYARTLRCIDR